MVGNYNDAQMLDGKRSDQANGFLVTVGDLHAREMRFTIEKTNWLWEQMCKYRTLFSDLTRGNEDNFLVVLQDPFSYWIEILQGDQLIGVIYLTGLQQIVDADIHMMFFDRQITVKADLTKALLHHFFIEFPCLHRITATLPVIYHATSRLAIKLGFKLEGTKRESQLMGLKWVDEQIYGILASEVLSVGNN